MDINSEKDRIHALLDEISNLIEENEKEDGTFGFDPVRVMIALDFAKTEIAKAVEKGDFT